MTTGAVENAAIGVMFAWLAVSAACQMPGRVTDRIRSLDVAGLIPNWPFFAPVPGTCDYYLLYRDELPDGDVTGWREVSLCDDRRPWHAVWNPRKREKKALFDLTAALMRDIPRDRLEIVTLSVPYLALLSCVSALPHAPGARATQFLVMMSDVPQRLVEPEPVFTSAVHPL